NHPTSSPQNKKEPPSAQSAIHRGDISCLRASEANAPSTQSYLELGGSSEGGWPLTRAGRGTAPWPARRCQPPPSPLWPRKPVPRPTYLESGRAPAPVFTLA